MVIDSFKSMKILYKVIAILGIAILGIVLVKNNVIEVTIENKLLVDNIQVKNIECTGILNINCELKEIKREYKHSNIVYHLEVKSLFLDNIFAMYIAYMNRENPKDSTSIFIKDIVITDSQNIFKEIPKAIDLNLTFIKNKLEFLVQRENMSMALKSDNQLFISTKNSVIPHILYDLYQFAFLEMKYKDGIEIARGLNISLGYESSEFISKKDFLENAIHRMIRLLSSEIESYDAFLHYNKNNQLSNVLEFILEKEGERSFSFSEQ